MRALDHDGFVTSYLSAISAEEFRSSLSDRNQLKLEGMLRKSISERKPPVLTIPEIRVGGNIGDAVWEPYYSHGNIFVDRSSFYSLLHRIRMYTATVLIADSDVEAEAILWTYMSTGAYLNGALVAGTEHPVYKPIESAKCTLHLHKGRNELVFLSDNLGVRDTRNMLAFQILTGQSHITTSIPDAEKEAEYAEGAGFLDAIRIGRGELIFPVTAPDGAAIRSVVRTDDYTRKGEGETIPIAPLQGYLKALRAAPLSFHRE